MKSYLLQVYIYEIHVVYKKFLCQSDPILLAVVLLLSVAGLNNRQGGQVNSYGYITCYVVKPGIFAAGAILALLSAVFGIAAFITLTPPQQPITNQGIALQMGSNVDPEKNAVPFPPQQFPPQQYPPQQYPPQQQH